MTDMRKVKKRFIILPLTLALLTACSNDEDEKSHTSDKRVPLEIVASIDLQAQMLTRAVETAWEAGDKIGVYMTKHGSTSELYSDAEGTTGINMPYTFDDGTNYETYGNTYRLFTPNTKKIYLSETSVDVYGYYPYAATKKDGTTAQDPTHIEINVSNQTSQKAIDFMRARTGNMNNENIAIELLFQHRLVKLVFNLKQGEGLLDDELKDATSLTMSINKQPLTAYYNIYSDAFTIVAGENSITPVKASSAPTGYVRTFEAIVLPNGANNPAGDRTVTIEFFRNSKDIIKNTFTIPGSTHFEKGFKYTYNVTVNATSIQVDPTKYTEQW